MDTQIFGYSDFDWTSNALDRNDTHYICSHDQLAELFTKVLSSTHFQHLMSKLESINLLNPS